MLLRATTSPRSENVRRHDGESNILRSKLHGHDSRAIVLAYNKESTRFSIPGPTMWYVYVRDGQRLITKRGNVQSLKI